MTIFEQSLLKEISSLPADRRADVLAFVRYLKISLKDEPTLEQEYDQAIKDARKVARKFMVTSTDIEAEIRAVRAGK